MKRLYTNARAAREPRLDELLREDGERYEPHGAQHAEERSEWTEGRTIVHGLLGLGWRAEMFDAEAS